MRHAATPSAYYAGFFIMIIHMYIICLNRYSFTLLDVVKKCLKMYL